MTDHEKWLLAQDSYEATRFNFILTELGLALTFGTRALSSNDSDTMRRNIDFARRAYEAALHFVAIPWRDQKRKRAVHKQMGKVRGLFRKFRVSRAGLQGARS